MSPRIDHRPPVIAFLFLVVLAIAVIGTNARALDRVVVAGEPLEVHAHVTGTAVAAVQGEARHLARGIASERVRPLSRAATRSHAPSVHAAAAARTVSTHGRSRHFGLDRVHRHHVGLGFAPLARQFRLH